MFPTYIADGVTSVFAVTFPYLDVSDVFVTVDGVAATYTWVSGSSLQLDTVPAAGAEVYPHRVTELDETSTIFNDGAVLTAAKLNEADLRIIYRQQEIDGDLTGLSGDVAEATATGAEAAASADAAAAAATTAAAAANLVGQKFIDEPTTLSIASFEDLNDLFAVLASKRITAPVTVTVGNETVTQSGVVTFDHPDAHLISFVGTTFDVTINSVGTITSNAAFSHDVVLNLASGVEVAVGHFIYIGAGAVADPDSSWLEGTWRVLSKASNAVTVRVTDARPTLAAPVAAGVAAKVQQSILRWNSAVTGGLVLSGVATGRFEDIVFDGQYDVVAAAPDAATDGITIATTVHATAGLPDDSMVGRSAATFRRCSIVRWRSNGVYTSGSATIDLTTCNSCSNGWRGLQAAGGPAAVFAKSSVASGNRKSGCSFETGGVLTLNNSTIAGNGEQGLYGTGGGSGVATSARIVGNRGSGVEVKDAGLYNIDSAILRDNGPYQVRAHGPLASVCVEGVDTAGATTAAFNMTFGGTIYARSTAPTCAEATKWSSDTDFRGFGSLIDNYGVIVPNVSYSSTAAPYGGFRLTPVPGGGLTIGTRTTATGPTFDRLTVDANGLDVAGAIKSSDNAGGVGYKAGAGGSVNQLTSKSTGVTLNRPTGRINLNGSSIGASSYDQFTLTNSCISSTDVVLVTLQSATSDYMVVTSNVQDGSCRVIIRNLSGAPLAEALGLNFAVIKAVNA